MESLLSLKKRRMRLFWSLCCCIGSSFIFLCAFYTYSLHQRSLYHPFRIATEMTGNPNAIAVSDTQPSSMKYSDGISGPALGLSGQYERISGSPLKGSSTAYEPARILKTDSSMSRVLMKRPGVSASSFTTTTTRTTQTLILLDESILETVEPRKGEKLDLPPPANSSITFVDDDGLPAELTCRSPASSTKLILLWTPFFDSWDYLTRGSLETCKECTNCRVTNNRSLLLESDAVVFHARDMSLADIPAVRLPNQRWIFYCLESPPYSDFPGLQFMHRMFNWTMSYRADSDVVTEYGHFKRVIPRKKLDKEALHESWKWKTKSVVWMSSHCPTDGGRDDYVSQLKKYIDVDEFGKCGTLKCPPDSTGECMKNFATTYKFFLAFENSVCKDYVTEKFFRALRYDMVPVVFGGADYRRYAPPGSYIDALAFKSPKHLAFFLAGIGSDFSLYSTYFQWRKDYEVVLDNGKECALCTLLHKHEGRVSVYPDIRKWWVGGGKCRRWDQKG